jgi:hypothetical protein
MTTCAYCQIDPLIPKSHVVPAFVVRHIKDNNPEKFILNSWEFRKLQEGLKARYLCAPCDNVTFSVRENHFKRAVFDPVQAGKRAAGAMKTPTVPALGRLPVHGAFSGDLAP